MAVRDVLADIGLSLDPASYNRPYAPGPAVAVGTALNTFGNVSALEKQRKEEAKKKADRAAIEAKIGVPLEFFNALPAENQADILQKAGFGTASPKKQKIPWLDNATLEEIQGQGLPPVPAQPAISGYGPMPGGAPPLEARAAVPERPGVPPGLGTGEDYMRAIYAHTGQPLPMTDLQKEELEQKRLQNRNLRAGKTMSGGKTLSAWQQAQVNAWLAQPENEGKTETDAIAALSFDKAKPPAPLKITTRIPASLKMTEGQLLDRINNWTPKTPEEAATLPAFYRWLADIVTGHGEADSADLRRAAQIRLNSIQRQGR